MPKFMYSGSYTAKGAAGILKEGATARRDEAARIAESFGGTLEAYYWCYGEKDFMCIMNVPDKVKITAFALAVGASGVFAEAEEITTLPEIPKELAPEVILSSPPSASVTVSPP